MPRFDDRGHGQLSEPIRRKLIEAGIPPENHSFERLASYFPSDFKIEKAPLETETIAAVLLHFLKHGIISLRGKKVAG